MSNNLNKDKKKKLGLFASFMAIDSNSPIKIITVSVIICVVAAALVTSIEIGLAPYKIANNKAVVIKNLLSVAGLKVKKGETLADTFNRGFMVKAIDLRTGKFTTAVDPMTYKVENVLSKKKYTRIIPTQDNISDLARQSVYQIVYFVKDSTNPKGYSRIILPIRGTGLWSMLWGFVALDDNFNTIYGINFYKQGETPGLGAKIQTSPHWKSLWHNKKLFDKSGKLRIAVVKSAKPPYQVDSISGATETSIAVGKVFHFWFGDYGYKLFLTNLKSGEISL